METNISIYSKKITYTNIIHRQKNMGKSRNRENYVPVWLS